MYSGFFNHVEQSKESTESEAWKYLFIDKLIMLLTVTKRKVFRDLAVGVMIW